MAYDLSTYTVAELLTLRREMQFDADQLAGVKRFRASHAAALSLVAQCDAELAQREGV
jgi:hypothetical protein